MKIKDVIERLQQEPDLEAEIEVIVARTDGQIIVMMVHNLAKQMHKALKLFL